MRPKIITDANISIIEDILCRWSGKLTWPSFAGVVAQRLGIESISQFTLMADEGVRQLYKRRKETLKQAKATALSEIQDVSIDALIRENEALRDQIAHLKSEQQVRDQVFKETFIRWQYNLSQMASVDMARLDLDAPLPKINRDD